LRRSRGNKKRPGETRGEEGEKQRRKDEERPRIFIEKSERWGK
jgi:hypothetical protein